MAAQCRVYFASPSLRLQPELIENAISNNFEALIYYDRSYWLEKSIGNNIHAAVQLVHPVRLLSPHAHQERVAIQKILTTHLNRLASRTEVPAKLARRLGALGSKCCNDSPNPLDVASHVQQMFRAQSRRLPGFVAMSFLKTVCNAWTTSSRFGSCSLCPFGCDDPNGSDLSHLVQCGSMREAAKTFLKHWERWPLSGNIMMSFASDCDPSSGIAAVTMIWHDILLHVFHSRKHGNASPIIELMGSRIKFICRNSQLCKMILRKAYRGANV